VVGVGVGLAAATAATRFLETVLFEVRPLDAGIYLGVALLLTVVAIGASLVPARRVSGVDPVKALKAD
jgi:putative ABC transport system permease protein